MSTPLNPSLRPDHCVALMLGEAIGDDVETYDVQALQVRWLTDLPAHHTRLFIEIDGRSFECIVFEKEGE